MVSRRFNTQKTAFSCIIKTSEWFVSIEVNSILQRNHFIAAPLREEAFIFSLLNTNCEPVLFRVKLWSQNVNVIIPQLLCDKYSFSYFHSNANCQSCFDDLVKL